MGKYKVIVTARSFAKADDQALRLLEEHDCDVVRLVAGVATFDEQIKEEIAAADAVIAGLPRGGQPVQGIRIEDSLL